MYHRRGIAALVDSARLKEFLVNAAPRLSVGLPVFNGKDFVAESIEALLGQSYTNFELIIADNASTDDTGDICREYAKGDSRIRYHRHPQNIGLAPNHNFVVQEARGELFKWAANDDLYACTLLERCVEALDEYPDVVLAHSWTAKINSAGDVTKAFEYPMLTSSPSAPVRFRSILFDGGGDDDYGVMRIEVLRRTAMKGSYHHADRTIIAELGLHGRFYQVPEWLYFRRMHPAQNGWTTMRKRCSNMDPRRASRLRHPTIRLYGEYVWAYIAAIQRAPLTIAERLKCYEYLTQWVSSRTFLDRSEPTEPESIDPLPTILVNEIVARRDTPLSRTGLTPGP
jgi:glycosyltransferase involved in cell wall biosynthesis